jgi:hypothetical protein
MVEIELALNVIRTLGILIGIVIALYEIMNIGKTRKMEFLTRIATTWNSKEFQKNWAEVLYQQYYTDYDEWRDYYSPVVNSEASSQLYSVLHSYNTLGNLLQNEIVELEFIWKFTPPATTMMLWEKVKILVEFWRNAFDDPTIYESFEYLYDKTREKHPQLQNECRHHKQYYEARDRWLVEREKR